MKYQRLRIIHDDLKSFLRGWYHWIVKPDPRREEWLEESRGMNCLGESTIRINWREELGEINENRISNIDLGCRLINGTRLEPNQIFSLRRFLKDASVKDGFREGPMVVNNQLVYSTGGGLCLVSTVLFNAALNANLEILEKHCHSTDLWGEDRFIGLGLDATYAYGLKDLKLRNSFTKPVYINLTLDRSSLLVECTIRSGQTPVGSVTISTEILQELLLEEEGGKELRKGWMVQTSRQVETSQVRKVTYDKIEKYNPFYIDRSIKPTIVE